MASKAKTKKLFLPRKYFAGLSKSAKTRRRKEIAKFGAMHWKDPKAYVGFETDKLAKKKTSGYTAAWHKAYPGAASLEAKAKVTGGPLWAIKESYNRGLAAWRTGHRPGATQQEWGYARSTSFLICGRTHYTTDSDIVRKAKKVSAKARKWFKRCKTSKLTEL